MRVTKMHGNGNDYIYYRPALGEDRDWEDISRRVSDRHFGIGADGLILALPSTRADMMMRMFNADGSEAKAIRVFPSRMLPFVPYKITRGHCTQLIGLY